MGPPIERRCQVSNPLGIGVIKRNPPKFINFRPAEVYHISKTVLFDGSDHWVQMLDEAGKVYRIQDFNLEMSLATNGCLAEQSWGRNAFSSNLQHLWGTWASNVRIQLSISETKKAFKHWQDPFPSKCTANLRFTNDTAQPGVNVFTSEKNPDELQPKTCI